MTSAGCLYKFTLYANSGLSKLMLVAYRLSNPFEQLEVFKLPTAIDLFCVSLQACRLTRCAAWLRRNERLCGRPSDTDVSGVKVTATAAR